MKTLLIIGAQGVGKSEAAKVAAQIARQHHGAAVLIHERTEETRLGARIEKLLSTRLAGDTPKTIRIVVKTTPSRGKEPAHRVLNMDRFARFPRGKAVTFAIREAVDACLASH